MNRAQAFVGRAGGLDRLDLISHPFEQDLKDFPARGLVLYEENEAGARGGHASLESRPHGQVYAYHGPANLAQDWRHRCWAAMAAGQSALNRRAHVPHRPSSTP